jgi:hypothetical protein
VTNNDSLITLTFTHPRSGKTFAADVGPDTTGQQALEGLQSAGFITPEVQGPFAMQLTRTGETLPLGSSLAGSGAQSGDTVAVLVASKGGV